MEGKSRTENVIFKCIVSTSGHPPDKAYLGTAEGDFKKRCYNHISSFKNKTQMKNTITPTLKWYIVKSVPSYSNITKGFMLWLHKKFLTYPNQDELWNKISELVSKYRHINKYLLSN